MNIVGIIQARMGSTRLPGKVLEDIGGKTMLARVVRRAQRAALLDQIVVATTVEQLDDVIADECGRLAVPVFRGEELDVLDRYYQAAEMYEAEAIVRITSDCPLIDPEIVDHVVYHFLGEGPDCASNTVIRTYPRGLDVSVMTMSALRCAWHEADESYQREHVTPYIYQNPDLFEILPVTGRMDYSGFRWTVDTVGDLEFVRALYSRLGNNDTFNWRDALAVLARDPELMEWR